MAVHVYNMISLFVSITSPWYIKFLINNEFIFILISEMAEKTVVHIYRLSSVHDVITLNQW